MRNEEKIAKVNKLMNDLDINDEDTRQEIYLGILSYNGDLTDADIILNVINPVIYTRFESLTEYRKKVIPMSSVDTNDKFFIYDKMNDKNSLKEINAISKNLGMLHSYVVDQYIKGSDSSKISNDLNLPSDITDAVVEHIMNAIKNAL